jgi:hypothetical protein
MRSSPGSRVPGERRRVAVVPAVTGLRDLIARRYPTALDARRVARDAGLALEKMAFGETALSQWDAIFRAALETRRLERLFNVLLDERPDDEEVADAVMAAAASAFLSGPGQGRASEAAAPRLELRKRALAGPLLGVGVFIGALVGWTAQGRLHAPPSSMAPVPDAAPCPSPAPPLLEDLRRTQRDVDTCLEQEHDDCICPKCRVPTKKMVTVCSQVLEMYP